jgi:hypothetical protein
MLIIIAAHIPIFALQRHEGRIFQPMALSVTTALIGSLISRSPWCRCWPTGCCAASCRTTTTAWCAPSASMRRCWTGP